MTRRATACFEQTEREVKLSADADFELPDLDGIAPGLCAAASGERQLHATYYDTDDLRLIRAGITVRYRCGESDAVRGVWTVKLPQDDDSPTALTRREITFG